jgi:hypothetical protein
METAKGKQAPHKKVGRIRKIAPEKNSITLFANRELNGCDPERNLEIETTKPKFVRIKIAYIAIINWNIPNNNALCLVL